MFRISFFLVPVVGIACTETATLPVASDFSARSSTSGHSHAGPSSVEQAAPSSIQADREWDVVIVGGGLAGLSVAAGLDRALLIESSAVLGGRAGAPGVRSFFFAGTPTQDAAGIDDSTADALDEWDHLTGAPPHRLTERYLDDTPEVHDRLVDMGIDFRLAPEWRDGVTPRQHLAQLDGSELVNAFVDALPTGVDVWTGTYVSSVVIDDTGVRGVMVDGEWIRATHVVLATGGFASNTDLLAPVVDLEDGQWNTSEPGSTTGDGLRWALDQGWGVASADSIGWMMRSIGVPDESGKPLPLLGDVPWIFVDSEGRRFADESHVESVTLATELGRRDLAFAIAEVETLRQSVSETNLAALDAHIADDTRIVCRAGSAALALAVGVDADGLRETLVTIERVRRGETADTYGRDDLPALRETDTLCSFSPGHVATKNFGGIDVDAEGRVVDARSVVVPGLHAVGEVAGMAFPGIGGAGGFDGSLSAVVWSGWRVGERLQQEVSAR